MSSKKSPCVILPHATRGQQSCVSDLNTLGQVFFLMGNLIKLIKCWCENHLENPPLLVFLQAAFSAHFIPRFAEPQCELARRQALTQSINGCSIRARPEQMKKAGHSSPARMQRGWTCFIFHSYVLNSPAEIPLPIQISSCASWLIYIFPNKKKKKLIKFFSQKKCNEVKHLKKHVNALALANTKLKLSAKAVKWLVDYGS